MEIKILTETDTVNVFQKDIEILFKQLSPNKKQISLQEIFKESPQTIIAYALNNDKIVGIALMAQYTVISGNKAWIEDVVVNSNQRGKGVGRMLIEKLMDEAKKQNTTEILLFTEDEKQAAIHLYTQLGFNQKNSRLYHYEI